MHLIIIGSGFYFFAHQPAYVSRGDTLVPAWSDLMPVDSRVISDSKIDALYQISPYAQNATYNISVGGSNSIPFTITN